jgi:N-acetylmuramoyl-L-alanine amidase
MEMRQINNIVVHTTATPQTATVQSIQNHWRNVLKWRNPGYHLIVLPNGNLVRLAEDTATTNGVGGHNANSLHVSYIGGIDAQGKPIDNRTPQQRATLLAVVTYWKRLHPNARVLGHRDFPNVAKACPCFNAIQEYKNV